MEQMYRDGIIQPFDKKKYKNKPYTFQDLIGEVVTGIGGDIRGT